MSSAKMKATTPPKLMPPFHSAAASGTLPTEQTKLMTATKGPTTTFSRLVQKPWPRTNTSAQTCPGTRTERNPAMTNPIAISFRSMVRPLIV